MKKRKAGRRKRHRGKRLLKRVIVCSIGSIIFWCAVLAAFYLWHLHLKFASSDVDVCLQGDTLSITWKPPFEQDACRLYRYDEWTKKYLSCGEYTGETMIVDGIAAGEKVTLRLRAVYYIKVFGQRISVPGFSRELAIMPSELGNIALNISANPESRTVRISWDPAAGDSYEVYLFDGYGKRQIYTRTNDNAVTLDFNREIPMPDWEHPVRAAVRAVCRKEDYTLYSPMSDMAVIGRDDLLEDSLFLEWEQTGERQYVLTWQECPGEWYEVQQWSQEERCWISEGVFQRAENMCYVTDHLPSGRQVRFRVISYDDAAGRDRGEFEAKPSEVTFHTDMSPLYCTVWPIIPLRITDSPQSGKTLGEVPAGEALCVLEEQGGCFRVLYKDCMGYVDSSFCMINLPEYTGDLCEYHIANSVHSVTTVHGYEIPGITGSVIRGYEYICLGGEDYLVPYLYPCTKKLCAAASNAARDGYRILIYDAFRPNEATRYLYDTAESAIDYPVAGSTFREIMTGEGQYRLSSFFASSVSAHNRGIALDVTLVDLETGEELAMQTDMLDSSWYSAITQNNDNARLLSMYMKEAGYNDLFSEWWHFQDDETRERIGLKSYLKGGVSPEGWKKDDTGWKYRLKDGTFYENTTEVIDGREYTFDAKGYCEREDFE